MSENVYEIDHRYQCYTFFIITAIRQYLLEYLSLAQVIFQLVLTQFCKNFMFLIYECS